MANPSLQIGNSNWAIKEDDLLGYSTVGTNYLPKPMTMTRASAGTRVNPEGLVETVELLGGELVDNGSFTTDSDWDKTGTWSIESNYATASGNSTSQYIQQDFTITNGKTYLFTYEIIENTLNGSGSALSGSGGFVQIFLSNVIGTHQVYITADDDAAAYALKIGVSATATTGTIKLDNVSVKEYTANNLARVDYDGTASSLLAEPMRTNLIPYSEDFTGWLRSGSITTTPNYTTSPSGQNNATRLQWTNATNFIYQNLSHVGSDFTLSIYLKSNTNVSQNVRLFMDNGAQTQNVVVTTQWQRFEFTNTSTPTQSNRNTGLIKSSSQVGDLDISIWGAQFEEGSYATSYIPTDGSTVTRVQDQYSKTGISNLINSEEGVLFAEMAALANDGTYREISLNDGTTNNVVEIRYNPLDNQFQFVIRNGGAVDVAETITLSNALDFNKIAFSYKSNDYKMYVNGVKVATDTSGTMPSGLDTLSLDWGGYGVNPFYGKVKQLQVFKTALTDDELTILTGTSGVHFFPSYAAMASVLTYTIE